MLGARPPSPQVSSSVGLSSSSHGQEVDPGRVPADQTWYLVARLVYRNMPWLHSLCNIFIEDYFCVAKYFVEIVKVKVNACVKLRAGQIVTV